MISCLCPTYNRFPDYAHLVNECLESFLRQGYDNCELIICNDTPGQQLVFDHPRVRIFNLDTRFPSLGDKFQWMFKQAKGDIFCRFDDDDISLPHRLSYSMDKLGDQLEWRAANCIYSSTKSFYEVVCPGNTHAFGIWRRQLLKLVPDIYPSNASGSEDRIFVDLAGHNSETIPRSEIYYIYRWGVSPTHLCSAGDFSTPQPHQRYYNQLGTRAITKGTFQLEPQWHRDYIEDVLGCKHQWASRSMLPHDIGR